MSSATRRLAVCRAQAPNVAGAHRNAVLVESLQKQERQFASGADPVAKGGDLDCSPLRSTGLQSRSGIGKYLSMDVEARRQFDGVATTERQGQHGAGSVGPGAHFGRDGLDPQRLARRRGEACHHALIERLLPVRKRGLEARKAHEAAFPLDHAYSPRAEAIGRIRVSDSIRQLGGRHAGAHGETLMVRSERAVRPVAKQRISRLGLRRSAGITDDR